MQPIIVHIEINASTKKVWEAITTHSLMTQWFFDAIPDFKPEIGFTTQFNVQSEERSFLHVWKVTEVLEEERIVCEWKYPEYNEASLFVTFELKSIDKKKTMLTITALGIEYFSETNIPEFTRQSCEQGWRYFANRLQQFLV